MRTHRFLAGLAALATIAAVATAGARPAGPIGRVVVQDLTDSPTPTTLYLHGHTPSGTVDSVQEFGAAGPGPFMDTNPPTEIAPKVATWTAIGNQNFRKNFLNAYWGGKLTGTITGNPTVSFWIVAPVSTRVEVSLFGDGGIGTASPMARKSQTILAPVPMLVQVEFTGLVANIDDEMVLQIGAYTDVPATPATPADSESTPAKILYDSTQFASGLAFGLLPISANPNLDDPAAIAHVGDQLIATNAGTGHVVRIDNGNPSDVIENSAVPGGFSRGPTGVAVDGDGRVYYAIADVGEIRVAGAGGGVLARGLGAPMGIAFGADGRLYVADAAGNRIIAVSPSGAWTTVATVPETPWGIAAAPGAKLAVSTNSGSGSSAVGRVRLVDPADGTSSVADALPSGTTAEGIAYGATGTLYIGSGRSGQLFRMPPGGGDSTSVNTGLGGPLALAFSPAGSLIIATQGEGRSDGGDGILSSDVGEAGSPLQAPSFNPSVSAVAAPVWVYKAGGIGLDPATFAGPLPSSELRKTPNDAFEPTMGIQNDGDMFYVGGIFDQAGGVLGSPDIYRSKDDGQTWTRHQPQDARGEDAPPITLDPYVWVDTETGRVFSFDLTSACQYLSYSDDDAETWTSNPLACGLPPVDHQTLVGGNPRTHTTNGYPNILYHCSNHVAESPCARSLDGGDTWEPGGVAYVGTDLADRVLNPTQSEPPARLSEITGGAQCGGLHGHAIVDPDGRVFVPKGHCGRPYITVSEDDATTFTQVPVSRTISNTGPQTTVASDDAGNLYYLWVGPGRDLYLSTSTDHGRTWSAGRNVTPPGVTEVNLPSIDAAKPGHVAIYFLGTPNTYGYTANTGKQAWNAWIVTSTDALSADATFTGTAVAPLSDPLFRGACGPNRCQGAFDFLDVVIAPDGRTWATAVDGCIDRCATNRFASSTAAKGRVAPLLSGPNLRTGAPLAPLP